MEAKTKSPSSQVCKRIIPQLLFSISLFSFASFIYKLLFSLFPSYSPKSHFSIDKNYLFLICNGLLVFLTKTSVFILPQDNVPNDINTVRFLAKLEPLLQLEGEATEANGQPKVANQANDEENEDDKLMMGPQMDSKDFWILEDDEDEENEDGKQMMGPRVDSMDLWILEHEENELDESEDPMDGELSTEELNKKVEDFIRRMKGM